MHDACMAAMQHVHVRATAVHKQNAGGPGQRCTPCCMLRLRVCNRLPGEGRASGLNVLKFQRCKQCRAVRSAGPAGTFAWPTCNQPEPPDKPNPRLPQLFKACFCPERPPRFPSILLLSHAVQVSRKSETDNSLTGTTSIEKLLGR
jgi:hypothetical protein